MTSIVPYCVFLHLSFPSRSISNRGIFYFSYQTSNSWQVYLSKVQIGLGYTPRTRSLSGSFSMRQKYSQQNPNSEKKLICQRQVILNPEHQFNGILL